MLFTKAGMLALHSSMHDCLALMLAHVDLLPSELLVAEVAGFGYMTLQLQFTHLLNTELVWVDALQARAIGRINPLPASSVDELRREQNRVRVTTAAYISSLDEPRLNAQLETTVPEWIGPARSPAFILLHVITHAFHHKGQIAVMLRLLGHPAPDTDMQRA